MEKEKAVRQEEKESRNKGKNKGKGILWDNNVLSIFSID